MRILVLLLATISLTGCSGKAWYYPYGPPYFEQKETTTVSDFIGGQRPDFSPANE